MCNSTAFRCYNLTEEQCDALSLAIGIFDAVIAFVSLSLLVCLLTSRKKDAWNSQIKRAIIAFSVFLTLSSINFSSVIFYNGFLPSVYCKVFYIFSFYTRLIIVLYMVAILGMFLVQIGSPVLNKLTCTQKLKSQSVVLAEVITHVVMSLSSSVFAVVGLFSDKHACSYTGCNPNLFYDEIVAVIIMSFGLLFISFSAIFLLYLYIRFFRRARITKRLIQPVLKFSFLLILLVTVLALEISLYWVLEETKLLFGALAIDCYLLEFVFAVTVLAMLHLPRSKCCKRSSTVTHRTPLLSKSNIQCTNPPSVWDHHNDPSTTVFNPPPEMSDCVSE